jgi:LemA protein
MLKSVLGIIGIIAIILLISFVFIYNKLIRIKTLVGEAWSGISVQLKRRFDLIPNIVETVKGYSGHEASVLEKVTKMRTAAMSAGSIDEKIKADNGLTGALKTLFSVTENYPDLKASQNFANLQKELSNIEEQLQSARRYYNAVVREYNTDIQTFPSNAVANILQYKIQPFFELNAKEERESPKIKF